MSIVQTIFENQHYHACTIRGATLVVTHKRKKHGRQGVQLVGPQAAEWIDAIKTALDKDEANALCRAVVNA